MKNLWQHLKLEKAGEGNGGGGSGGGATGDLLTGGDGGSGTPPGTPSPGAGAGAGGTPPDAGGGGTSSEGTAPTDWKSQLPAELQEDKTIARFGSPADLAAAYRNLQRQFSSDKLIVPGKHATDDDWKQVYTKLGLPAEVKDYQVKFQEGVTVDEKFAEEFRTLAHAAGILPKQAQKLADWFGEKNKGAEEAFRQQIKASFETEVANLKKEWGDGFDKKVGTANFMFRQLPPELQKTMSDAGFARNTQFVRAMAHLADKYAGENALVQADGAASKQLTPAEARKQIDTVMGDMAHPYHVKDHPGHKGAVAEMQKLFASLHK